MDHSVAPHAHCSRMHPISVTVMFPCETGQRRQYQDEAIKTCKDACLYALDLTIAVTLEVIYIHTSPPPTVSVAKVAVLTNN